jgi:hypothetical protein
LSKKIDQRGELYKIIIDWEKYGNDRTITTILDAARAEHPPEWNKWIIKQPEYIRHDKHIDMHDMWQRYAWEMIDWFKRWFGGVP